MQKFIFQREEDENNEKWESNDIQQILLTSNSIDVANAVVRCDWIHTKKKNTNYYRTMKTNLTSNADMALFSDQAWIKCMVTLTLDEWEMR